MTILSISSKRKKTFKKNLKNGRANSDYENLQIIRIDLTETVSTFKKNHWRRLNDFTTSSKTSAIIKIYAILTKFRVTPLLLVSNKLMTNFKKKVNVFGNFFREKCQLKSSSTLNNWDTWNYQQTKHHWDWLQDNFKINTVFKF